MKRTVLFVLVTAVMAPAGGCITRAAKEAILSPKGFSVPTALSGSQQNIYSKIEFQDFSNTGIATMPANMNQLLRTELLERTAALKPSKAILAPDANRILIVRGQYVY